MTLALLLLLAAEPPRLIIEESEGGVDRSTLSPGWRFCGSQADGLTVEDGGLTSRALPAEIGEQGEWGPYLLYARVQQDGSQDCEPLAFTVTPLGRSESRTDGEVRLATEAIVHDLAPRPREGQASWSYFLQGAETSLRLPDAWKLCAAPQGMMPADGGVELQLQPQTGASFSVSVDARDGDCTRPSEVDVEVGKPPPALAADDLALDWRPDAPSKLAIRVRSTSLSASQRAKYDFGVEGLGVKRSGWSGCQNGACIFTLVLREPFDQLDTVVVGLKPSGRSRALGADGRPWSPTPIELKRWYRPTDFDVSDQRVLASHLDVAVMKVPLHQPVLRFFDAHKPAPCTADTPCALVRATAAGPVLNVAVDAALRKSMLWPSSKPFSVVLAPRSGIELIDERWKNNPGPLTVRVAVADCRWRATQLTRLVGGLHGASVLVRLTSDKAKGDCPLIADWEVTGSGNVVAGPRGQVVYDGRAGGVVQVPIEKLTAAGPFTLTFKLGGVPLNGLDAVRIEVDASPLLAPDKIFTQLDPPLGVTRAGPSDRNSSNVRAIGVGRPSWVSFRANGMADRWALEVAGPSVRGCSGVGESSSRGNQRLPFRESFLCLEGLAASDAAVELIAEQRGPVSSFRRKGVDRGERDEQQTLDELVLSLGTRPVTLPWKVRPVRLLLPLRDRTILSCGEDELRDATQQGIRAVRLPRSGDCTLTIDLPEESPGNKYTVQKLVRSYGAQYLALQARASKDEGKTWKPAVIPLTDGMALVENMNQRDETSGTLTLRLGEDQRLELDDYDLLELTLGHASPEGALTSSDDSRSSSEPFRAVLRKMPKIAGRPWAARWGARGYFSFGNPAGMVRTASPGFAVTTSSAYSKWQTAIIGLSVLFIVELWDFDLNVALLPFNPQFHIGALVSSDLDNLTGEAPRFSGVAGLGIRLPGGTAPNSALEISSSILVWLEVTGAARGGLFLDGLIGFKTTFGSLGN